MDSTTSGSLTGEEWAKKFRLNGLSVSCRSRAKSSPIASAEDTVLSKLEWYRLGNEVSERQWDDVARVMKILGSAADMDYMERNAVELGVADLLNKLTQSIM